MIILKNQKKELLIVNKRKNFVYSFLIKKAIFVLFSGKRDIDSKTREIEEKVLPASSSLLAGLLSSSFFAFQCCATQPKVGLQLRNFNLCM